MADLITTAQAAAELHVTKVTISRWAAAGLLVPAVKLPGRNGAMLFKRKDIQQLAAQRKVS